MSKNDISLILIFLASIIIFFLFGFLINKINLYLLVFIISFLVLVFAYIFLKFKEQVPIVNGKTALRYTMLCHKCNWEWMSNTAEKQPVKCPNCGEKSKLEVVGWRKVNVIARKSNKNLMNYLEK